MTKLVRLILGFSLLLISLSGCDNNGSPEPDGGTMSNEQRDWPTANPPEGWVVENHYVDPDSNEFNPRVIVIHREGQEVGDGPQQISGSPSVTVGVSSQLEPTPEEIAENNVRSGENTERLEDRVIDGVTFCGVSSTIESRSGHIVRYNRWWGNIPKDDGFLITIEEHNGVEDETVLEELYAISDTIVWPEEISWARDKWWSF